MRRDSYNPGEANRAHIESSEGETWALVLTKNLHHAPDKVWAAITDPAQLREWAPFDASGNLGTTGAKVILSTVGAPSEMQAETVIKRAEPPHLLEYAWGGGDLRWELESTDDGTQLTLWANINRRYIAMGAAGWHVCLDVLGFLLDGDPLGRIVAHDALQFEGWQRLHREYAQAFGGQQ